MRKTPLFIPLNSAPFDAFAAGSKRWEYRPLGARWNARTCEIGREVTISKGYGKKARLMGFIESFEVIHDPAAIPDYVAIYGNRKGPVAAIKIYLLPTIKA